MQIQEKCANCGKEFRIKSIHKKKYKGPFCCSRECRGNYIREVYKGNSNPNFKYENEIQKLLSRRTSDIKRRCQEKGIEFNLSENYLYDLYISQNGLCAYSGIPLKPATTNFKNRGQADLDVVSVDRIIPEIGYTEGNLKLCCSAINKLKGNADPEELQSFISAIALKSFGTCKIRFKKLRENAEAPYRAKLGDGGYDLNACHIEDLGDKLKVYTGISCEPDFGWVLLAIPRSSVHKSNLRLSNSIGLIDNQYRGEILAIFDKKENGSDIKIGDRIIQLLPIRLSFVEFVEVDELSETERGTGGYGSSGK